MGLEELIGDAERVFREFLMPSDVEEGKQLTVS